MCFRYFCYLLTRQVHLLKSQQKRMTRVKPKITWVHSDDAVAPSSISNAFRHHHAQKEQLEKQLFWHGKNYSGLTVCADTSEWFPLSPPSPISLEGIPKHPQVQSLLSWAASMFWKVCKNAWAVPGALLNERKIIAAFILWEMCEDMRVGTDGQSTLTGFVSVSKWSLYPNLSDLVLFVSPLPEKISSENFTGVRRRVLEGRWEQGVSDLRFHVE